MSDVPLEKQIMRQERKIIGALDWITRARRNEIKRPAEAIAKAADDLLADRAILATLKWCQKNSALLKQFMDLKDEFLAWIKTREAA